MKAALLFLIVLISSCTPTENVSHSGTCRKCKQEKDSITSLIINAIKDGRTDNQR